MNILVFSWRGPNHPLAGGAEQVMHEHMKGWIEKGHKVTLFTSFYADSQKEEKVDGININRRGYQILGVHISAFFWYLFSNHPKYDLVIDQFHGIPFFTPLYVRKRKLAVLQEVARDVWLKNDLPIPLNWIFGVIGYLCEPIFFLFYRNIPFMVGSQSAKDDLSMMGVSKSNITIVPHGVIIKKPKTKLPKEKIKTIAFLGALAKDKGIEDAVKAFGILGKKENWQFWIIGKGGKEYIDYLKNLANEVGIKNKTTFWGFVSQEKKFELLSRSHVMINPSYREGWGLVNIEANSMGVPVVAYNSVGLVDSVKHNESGLIVNKNTPENLADEVTDLLNDSKKLKRLSQSSINWSKNFTWKKSKELSLKLIQSID